MIIDSFTMEDHFNLPMSEISQRIKQILKVEYAPGCTSNITNITINNNITEYQIDIIDYDRTCPNLEQFIDIMRNESQITYGKEAYQLSAKEALLIVELYDKLMNNE